ncbi:MAG: response regulator [Rhodospirillaceae bacterium]
MTQSHPRILIVEDQYLIAMDMELMAESCGCSVIGSAGNVADALDLVRRETPDCAFLDINLGDERVWPVAERLRDAGVPFVLTTGYAKDDVPSAFEGYPVVSKPIALEDLRRALRTTGVEVT